MVTVLKSKVLKAHVHGLYTKGFGVFTLWFYSISGTNMTVNCELGIDGTVLDGLVPVLS
jgi:hypothetical protein